MSGDNDNIQETSPDSPPAHFEMGLIFPPLMPMNAPPHGKQKTRARREPNWGFFSSSFDAAGVVSTKLPLPPIQSSSPTLTLPIGKSSSSLFFPFVASRVGKGSALSPSLCEHLHLLDANVRLFFASMHLQSQLRGRRRTEAASLIRHVRFAPPNAPKLQGQKGKQKKERERR